MFFLGNRPRPVRGRFPQAGASEKDDFEVEKKMSIFQDFSIFSAVFAFFGVPGDRRKRENNNPVNRSEGRWGQLPSDFLNGQSLL